MNPFEMVVAIIVIITIGKVLNTRYRARLGFADDEDGNPIAISDPDAARLRDEVKNLKERIAVLERIATDDRGVKELKDEIEKLRNH